MHEGDHSRRIYQIVRGTCRVEQSGKLASIISAEKNGLFGEISFLEDSPARACVIANETTTVHIIEGYYLNILFLRFPRLAGRFYYYLAQLLAKRLRNYSPSNTEDEIVDEVKLSSLKVDSSCGIEICDNTLVMYLEKMAGNISHSSTGEESEPEDNLSTDESLIPTEHQEDIEQTISEAY